MKKFEQLVEDYATQPVPIEKTVHGVRIGLVLDYSTAKYYPL